MKPTSRWRHRGHPEGEAVVSDKPSILDADPIPWEAEALLTIWPPEVPVPNHPGTLTSCVEAAVEALPLLPPQAVMEAYVAGYRIIDREALAELASRRPAQSV